MSKRSAFKINKRNREGVESQRRVQAHVIKTQTLKLASQVSANLEAAVKETVEKELDRRGYPEKSPSSSTAESSDPSSSRPGSTTTPTEP